ncbi:MAG: outer membrane beta-barrel protein [Candidatus Acidiferrales bacterium]
MKMAALALLLAVMCVPAKAQDFLKWNSNKLEIGGGYTYVSLLEVDGTHRLNMNGFNAFGEYRIIKWISLGVDLSGTYNFSHAKLANPGTGTGAEPSNGTTQLYNMYIGPRFYPFGHAHKITPFGHFMIGPAIYGNNIPPAGGYDAYSYWDHAYSWMAGGGLDLHQVLQSGGGTGKLPFLGWSHLPIRTEIGSRATRPRPVLRAHHLVCSCGTRLAHCRLPERGVSHPIQGHSTSASSRGCSRRRRHDLSRGPLLARRSSGPQR